MKPQITGLITFLFISFSLAQIEFDPDVILLESEGLDNSALERVVITNTGPEAESVHWMFEKGDGFPEEWTVIIADDNLDYVPGTIKNHPFLPNFIAVSNIEKISCSFQAKDFVLSRGTKIRVMQSIMRIFETKNKNERLASMFKLFFQRYYMIQ